MGILVTILAVLLAVALLPTWPYSRGWGYTPFAGGLGLLVIVLVVLVIMG